MAAVIIIAVLVIFAAGSLGTRQKAEFTFTPARYVWGWGATIRAVALITVITWMIITTRT